MITEKDINNNLIFPFLKGEGKQNNIRSRTETINYDGIDYFLKTSNIDLASEAMALETANKLVAKDLSVSSVPFVYYSRDHNVLITEFVSGKSLFNEVWNNTSALRFLTFPNATRPDWVVVFTEIYEWISLFHMCSLNSENSITRSKEIKNKLAEDINRKIFNIHLLAPSIFTKKEWEILNKLAGMGEDSEWQSMSASHIHGDFTLSNMIINNKKVFILDFADTREGFIIEDIVRMWAILWEVSQCGLKRYQALSPVLEQIVSCCCDAEKKSNKPFMYLRIFNAIIRIHESLAATSLLSWSTRLILKKLAKIQLYFLKNEVLN